MQYVANPVIVEAQRIKSVQPVTVAGTDLYLENGSKAVATLAQTARIVPEVGDYVVTESDGYEYITPRDVFERDFALLPIQRKAVVMISSRR